MSPRKYCLLDTRLINIQLTKSVTLNPTLTRKLCPSDARWERENQPSPDEGLSLYQPSSRAGPHVPQQLANTTWTPW